MQRPIRERISELREEIAQIRESNRLYAERNSKAAVPAADHERRMQRRWGMDAGGKPFIEAATTVNVSYTGVLLKDVPAKLSVGDTIALLPCDQASTSAVSVSFGLGRDGT